MVQFDYIDGAGTVVTGLDHGTKPFKFDGVHGKVSDEKGRRTKEVLIYQTNHFS